MKLVNYIPKFLRVALFSLIEEQVNEIDEQEIGQFKQTFLARCAAVLGIG